MLDSADLKILKLLQSNGRMTNQELATQCNISPSACHERFKRLRDDGYILGFSTVLDAGKLNKAFLIYVQVRLASMGGTASEDFTAAAREIPEIMECHMIIGGFDYLLKIRVADLQSYRSFMGDTLSQMPGVREIRSFAVLEEVKSSTSLPI